MRRFHDPRRSSRSGRAGFTLIELLVVIAIIAILAALTTSAVMKYLGVQPVSNTRTQLKTLNSEFLKKWNEITERAKREPIPSPYDAALHNLAGGNPELKRVIWVKIQQRLAFPETFAEALSGVNLPGAPIPAQPAYVKYMNKYGLTASNPAKDWESGVCLLMAMQRSASGGELKEETLGGVGKFVSLTIVPNKQVPCLVDGFGKPLAFARWPMGFDASVTTDASDPQGLLKSPGWSGSAAFTGALHPISAGRLTPLIASAGADGKLGLTLNPGKVDNWKPKNPVADTYDNIYSDNP